PANRLSAGGSISPKACGLSSPHGDLCVLPWVSFYCSSVLPDSFCPSSRGWRRLWLPWLSSVRISPWQSASGSAGLSHCISAYSSGYKPTANDGHSADNPSFEEGNMEQPWYFLQLSDTHIVADTRQESHGVNTYATLSRALAQINHLDPPPAFVMFTG